MMTFKTEKQAFEAAHNLVAARCLEKGKSNCGFRVLKCEQRGYKVLMIPDRYSPDYNKPFYI